MTHRTFSITAAVAFAALLAGCASTGGLAPSCVAAFRRHGERSTHARRRARLARRVAHDGLVEGARRPAARRADRRGAREQPDAARSPQRARARRWRSWPPRARRCYPRVDAARRRTRERFPEHGLTPPPYAGSDADGQPAAGDAVLGDRLLGQEPRRRTKRARAARAPPRSTPTPRASRCRRASRRRTCSCSARTCSSTCANATLRRARAGLHADARSQRRGHRFEGSS